MDPNQQASNKNQTQDQPQGIETQPQDRPQPQQPQQPVQGYSSQGNTGAMDPTLNNSSFFSKLFKGRINRRNFIVGILLIYVIIAVSGFTLGYIFGLPEDTESEISGVGMIFSLVANIFATFYALSFGIRRLHDIGKSGWFVLLSLIPLVNLGIFIWLLVAKGQTESNKYGNPPMPKIDIGNTFGFS